jgi:hypothetical protein
MPERPRGAVRAVRSTPRLVIARPTQAAQCRQSAFLRPSACPRAVSGTPISALHALSSPRRTVVATAKKARTKVRRRRIVRLRFARTTIQHLCALHPEKFSKFFLQRESGVPALQNVPVTRGANAVKRADGILGGGARTCRKWPFHSRILNSEDEGREPLPLSATRVIAGCRAGG